MKSTTVIHLVGTFFFLALGGVFIFSTLRYQENAKAEDYFILDPVDAETDTYLVNFVQGLVVETGKDSTVVLKNQYELDSTDTVEYKLENYNVKDGTFLQECSVVIAEERISQEDSAGCSLPANFFAINPVYSSVYEEYGLVEVSVEDIQPGDYISIEFVSEFNKQDLQFDPYITHIYIKRIGV